MTNLTRPEIEAETKRLVELVSWEASDEGIDYHFVNKNSSATSQITKSIIMTLVEDASDHGYNPVRLIGDVLMRLWAQSEDDMRADIEKLVNSAWTEDDSYMDRLKSIPFKLEE